MYYLGLGNLLSKPRNWTGPIHRWLLFHPHALGHEINTPHLLGGEENESRELKKCRYRLSPNKIPSVDFHFQRQVCRDLTKCRRKVGVYGNQYGDISLEEQSIHGERKGDLFQELGGSLWKEFQCVWCKGEGWEIAISWSSRVHWAWQGLYLCVRSWEKIPASHALCSRWMHFFYSPVILWIRCGVAFLPPWPLLLTIKPTKLQTP